MLAIACAGGSVEIRNPLSGWLLNTMIGQGSDVLNLAFTPDGKVLAAGGQEASLKLWDVATAQELLSLEGHQAKGSITALAFSSNGSMLASAATGDGKGEILLWSTVLREDSSRGGNRQPTG
jgi:WD40 repeat protein